MRHEPIEIRIGKELPNAPHCCLKPFSTGSCARYIWHRTSRNVDVGIDSLISSVLCYFGVSSILWGESAALCVVLVCDNHPHARLVWGTWWSPRFVLRILECLHPAFGSMPLWKEKLAEFPLLVILEEMGHLGKSEDLFLKKSDSILWLKIGILDSY